MKKIFGKEYTDAEFEVLLEETAKKYEQKLFIKGVQKERIRKFISSMPEEKLEETFLNFLKWEEKYEEFWYAKGIETDSTIIGHILDIIEESAEEYEDHDDNVFLHKAFFYKGYVFKLYVGQGSFWRIMKGEEIVFQST